MRNWDARTEKCYEKLGRKDKQLETVQKLIRLKPDNDNYLTISSILLIELERYEEALKTLFHLDYLKPDNMVYKSCIETCALHLRKFDVALRYNQAILENSDYKERYYEYLTAGHIHFAMGDWKEALTNYKKYMTMAAQLNKIENRKIDPEREFLVSSKILTEMGISPSDIRLMHDMISL